MTEQNENLYCKFTLNFSLHNYFYVNLCLTTKNLNHVTNFKVVIEYFNLKLTII